MTASLHQGWSEKLFWKDKKCFNTNYLAFTKNKVSLLMLLFFLFQVRTIRYIHLQSSCITKIWLGKIAQDTSYGQFRKIYSKNPEWWKVSAMHHKIPLHPTFLSIPMKLKIGHIDLRNKRSPPTVASDNLLSLKTAFGFRFPSVVVVIFRPQKYTKQISMPPIRLVKFSKVPFRF